MDRRARAFPRHRILREIFVRAQFNPAGAADCDWVRRRHRSCGRRFASETERKCYHFAFFGLIPTFLLMTLITAVAFLLSVRLNAIVVAVLGIAGGFLTPILLSTNQDNPLG